MAVTYDEIKEMSLRAIRKLNFAGIKCVVLTKGVLPYELASLSKNNEYGITLISLDEDYREKAEPGAASYEERLLALKRLHDAGYKTWVSVEPYPTPNLIRQDLNIILNRISFTDRIIFGRTNYNKEVSAFVKHKDFYNMEACRVIRFCREHGISCHIKNGTLTLDNEPILHSISALKEKVQSRTSENTSYSPA